jgi:hypothetical protein
MTINSAIHDMLSMTDSFLGTIVLTVVDWYVDQLMQLS